MREVMKRVAVKAISHITGGGFIENVPRMLRDGTRAKVEKASFPMPPVFSMIAEMGKVPEAEMYNTFNMGIGMIFAVGAADADTAVNTLRGMGEAAYVVGEVAEGECGIDLV